MLYSGFEIEALNRHRKIISDAAKYRKHFGPPREDGPFTGALILVARAARRLAERIDRSLARIDPDAMGEAAALHTDCGVE